ncbi:MAG: nickel pincer cofactor biosynthesis protein LarB [Bacillota bacterium]
MNRDALFHLLQQVAGGDLSAEQALHMLRDFPFTSLEYANLDTHRQLRTGFPEVIFCQGKTPQQTGQIFARLAQSHGRVLATRATAEHYRAVQQLCPQAVYQETARCITLGQPGEPEKPGLVLVLSAGTADLPVAEEAVVTARMLGCRVERAYDVGVAGIHRLLDRLELLRRAAVIIVVAGMEGALASVVGGLTERPVIAVPTSVGYGASFGGLAALLAMLNSCASGVGVVNIDNGFGAACLAGAILDTAAFVQGRADERA